MHNTESALYSNNSNFITSPINIIGIKHLITNFAIQTKNTAQFVIQ